MFNEVIENHEVRGPNLGGRKNRGGARGVKWVCWAEIENIKMG